MELLKDIERFVKKEGRLPKARDCNDSEYLKSAGVYNREFGSWGNTIDVFVATLIDENINLKEELQAVLRPSPLTEQDRLYEMSRRMIDEDIPFADRLKPREKPIIISTTYLKIEEAMTDIQYQGSDYYRDNFDPEDMAKVVGNDKSDDNWEYKVKEEFDDFMFTKLL